MDEQAYQEIEEYRERYMRICDSSCSHYDHINRCCWQSGPWGLCFDVQEGDYCRLGYEEEH